MAATIFFCIIGDCTDKFLCDPPSICDHLLSCKIFSSVGLINMKCIKDSRVEFPTVGLEVISDSNISLSGLGSPQVSCESTA